MNSVKQNKGVTLVVLLVTVIVMLILATVGTGISMQYVNNLKLRRFNSELELITDRINVIAKKIELGNESYSNYGTNVTDEDKTLLKNLGISDESIDKFKLFDKTALESIDITGIKQSVYINFGTGQVVSKDGITVKGKTYHTINK